MTKNVQRRQTASDAREPAGKRTLSKDSARRNSAANTPTTDKAAGKKKEKKHKARVPQRSMTLEDLVPGPLPEETTAPQQSAIPRKIKL